MIKAVALATAIVVLSSAAALAAPFENFDSYTAPTYNGTVMFQAPTYSGSTGAQIDPGDNGTSVVSEYPAGTPWSSSAPNFLSAWWSWVDTGTWLRLTTYNASFRPNPSVDLTKALQFKVFYPAGDPIGIAVGIRDNGNSAADGENGTASGAIEWVGATGTGAGLTHIISPSPDWQVLTFDFASEPKGSLTGDGVLNNTRGTFESLMIVRSAGGSVGPYYIGFDDFEIVPEPSSLIALAGGLVGFFGIRRRR